MQLYYKFYVLETRLHLPYYSAKGGHVNNLYEIYSCVSLVKKVN